MHDYSPNLMVSVLRKEYPEIAEIIAARIKDTLPEEKLYDLSNINLIVTSFKNERGVKVEKWTNCKGKANITYERELLIAVLLLYYDPEKIMQLTKRQTVNGLLKCTANLIGTSTEILSMSIPAVIVAFKAYESFREEVYRLYELISIENKFFE